MIKIFLLHALVKKKSDCLRGKILKKKIENTKYFLPF